MYSYNSSGASCCSARLAALCELQQGLQELIKISRNTSAAAALLLILSDSRCMKGSVCVTALCAYCIIPQPCQ